MAAFANAYRDYALSHPGRYAATQAVQLDPAVLARSTVYIRTIELTQRCCARTSWSSRT